MLHVSDIYSVILIGGYVYQEQQKGCHMSAICPPNWRVRASEGLEAIYLKVRVNTTKTGCTESQRCVLMDGSAELIVGLKHLRSLFQPQ